MAERIGNINCVDSYITDMARYSITVNRRRAIPERKDGLKVGQRRIIYCMWKNEKALSFNTKVKCAAIVGTTMSLYHAHGDCFHSQTPIYGIYGNVYTIGELYKNKVGSLLVYAVDPHNGKVVPAAAHSFRVGQYTNAVYHIVLSNGFELRCTGNHPFLLSDMTWIQAKDIKPGTVLFEKDLLYQKDHRLSFDDNIRQGAVVNVWIEEVDQEPMYDFTVDGYENMLIPVGDPRNNEHIPFICAHNSSIYDAMKPLANWFDCKEPLIIPSGNFGTVMGDGAAASRYTEAYLSPFSIDTVIAHLKDTENIVDWHNNYQDTCKEPDYLPTTVPLLLINGTYGIAIGLVTSIPTHNTGEVIDAALKMLDNPNADIVLIPDGCQKCHIIDTNWKSICNKGNGKYRVRSIIDITEERGKPMLVIKSLPDGVYTEIIKKRLNDLISENKLPQIQDIHDKSTGTSVDLRIELRKGADAQFLREALFKYTDCEKSFSVNFEVVDNIETVRMSYKSYMQAFIQDVMINKFREYCNLMQDATTRYHQVDAYIKVMQSGYIDDIIAMIKKQTTINDDYIIEFLIKNVHITDVQAKFIINSNLKYLSAGYLNRYLADHKVLKERIDFYNGRITNDDIIKEDVRADLLEAKAKYSKPRMYKVIKVSDDSNIPQGTFKVIVTENNYIRKISENDVANSVKGDRPNFVLKADNTESILLFDNKGKVFKLPIHRIPVMGRSDAGLDVRGIIRGLTADIIAVMYEPRIIEASKFAAKHYMSVVTENNYIKKLDIDDFTTVPPSGIIYTKLSDGDSVKEIQIIADQLDSIVYSSHKVLRISAKEIPNYKRNTLGVAAMNTTDKICGISTIYPDATDVIVITTNGRINKFDISGLTKTQRNKAGTGVIKLSSGDSIYKVYGVNDNNILKVVTTSETIDIPLDTIKGSSSVSTGTKMISTKSDRIIKTEILIKP